MIGIKMVNILIKKNHVFAEKKKKIILDVKCERKPVYSLSTQSKYINKITLI